MAAVISTSYGARICESVLPANDLLPDSETG